MILIALALAWLAGVIPVAAWGAPWWMGAAWIAVAMPIFAMATGGRRWRLATALLAAAACAGWQLAATLNEAPPHLARYVDQEVTLFGTVVSEPDPGPSSTTYDIRAETLTFESVTVATAGTIRATVHQYAAYLPGDRLELTGKIELPPSFDGFDYRSYLRQRGILATMRSRRTALVQPGDGSAARAITRARIALDQSLQRSLPEPEASLAGGIAFGRDGNLSRADKETFNRSGLRHLVAVSGSNVSLISAVTFAIFIPSIGRRRAAIPAALTIATYLLAAGFSPSVIRAGIMASIYLGGGLLGRPQSGLPALGAAFIAMTAINPLNTLDPGFQLSMAATAGLLTIAPWLDFAMERAIGRLNVPVPRWLIQVAALSLSASAATAPIMWASFGEISLVSPLANIVVEPFFVLAFWASVVTALLGLISAGPGNVAGFAAYYPLSYIHEVARLASSIPLASVGIGGGSPGAALAAAVPLGAAALAAYRYLPPLPPSQPALERRRKTAGWLLAAGAGSSFALAAIPVSLLPAAGPGRLSVAFLDVGQGDAILVTTPHGRQVLIDGGPSAIGLARELGAAMPHWDRSLDAIILTHPEEDHMGGLPGIAERLSIATGFDGGARNTTQTFMAFEGRLPPRGALARGDSLLIDGVTFEVAWPPGGFSANQPNAASIVLRITFGDVSFLLAGDIEAGVQRELMSYGGITAEVLKVPHHGSRTSDPAFLAAVNPAVAVIQVGEGNRFGHPAEEVVAALSGTRLYRTDLNGRVTITSDGREIRVSTAR